MARRRRGGSTIYVASLVLHAGVAAAVVNIDEQVVHEATSVTIQEVKKKEPAKKAEERLPPPPPSQEQVRKVAKTKAPPKAVEAPAPAPAAEAAPAAAAPVADFGLAMTGGVGAGGLAVPLGSSTRNAPLRPTRTQGPKALSPSKASKESAVDECLEALIKPKPLSTPQPAYADRAREAGIQGKVRVELTVDETGAVVSTRVLESLGYGLDEAALEAAKSWRFEPATRCGKVTATTFVVGIRFTL